ncbi:hypothetical protein [Brevibacillus centrosporus]|uniref:hypothetical protein n=1 Tax=Brevibacillus centrosporus TaxID=54910 RepID=UPI003819D377
MEVSLTIKIVIGIVALIFFVLSLIDMSGTFWILVVLGVIAAVIANLAHVSGQTYLTMVVIGMGGVGGWFVGGVLGVLFGLSALLDKLIGRFNKWHNS